MRPVCSIAVLASTLLGTRPHDMSVASHDAAAGTDDGSVPPARFAGAQPQWEQSARAAGGLLCFVARAVVVVGVPGPAAPLARGALAPGAGAG